MLISTSSHKKLAICLSTLSLLACSTTSSGNSGGSSSKSSYKSTKKSSMPKVPQKNLPGGNGDNWRYLGTTDDNLLALEINDTSITSSNSINKFQDRKTVITPNKYNYQSLPNYKYSLSWWQLNCSQKQFMITSSSVYDTYGNLLKNYSFSNNQQWSSVTNGSIAEQQYNYVCKGINRNLGY